MLAESMVSILALIAATSLFPLDYFQINVSPEKFAQILPQLQALGFTQTNLIQLSSQVGEVIAGRPGGAVSLAVGMAQVFSSIPGLAGLMSYWYHFAIMFEALFILTTIDAGTRIARFILQEALGRVYSPFARTNWLPGTLITSLLIVFAWGYFIYTGSVSTIWPMFGVANQLLATLALAIGTSFLINNGKRKYIWITLTPMIFVGITTITGGLMNMINIYIPQISVDKTQVQGTINTLLTTLILICVLLIIVEAMRKWFKEKTIRQFGNETIR
jgi:carbon starvation protein